MQTPSAAPPSRPSLTPPPRDPIFAFDDPIEYLNYELRRRRQLNPSFSLRAWARELGFANPSFLSQVLKQERSLKPDLAARLAESLGLRGRPLQYFQMMVMGAAADGAQAKSSYQKLIRDFRPKRARNVTQLSLELYSMVSEWYHYVITEMTQLRDFSSDPRHVQRRLGGNLDLRTVREALDRLVRLGFLVRRADGRLARAPIGNYVLDPNTSSELLRNRHRQWLDKARLAIEEQTVEERDFYASTLCFRRENLPKVREILRDAHRRVLELESTENGEEVYQLCSQFFRLTKPAKKEKIP